MSEYLKCIELLKLDNYKLIMKVTVDLKMITMDSSGLGSEFEDLIFRLVDKYGLSQELKRLSRILKDRKRDNDP